MKKYLVNKARSFIYSTGLPPASAAAAIASLDIIGKEKNFGKELLDKAALFRSMLIARGIDIPESPSQILQIPVGENDIAVKFSEELWNQSLLATAIRPPTVPKGTARLRLSVSLAHSEDDLSSAAVTIATAAAKMGIL